MRKFLAAIVMALALAGGSKLMAGDTDPAILHEPARAKSFNFVYNTAGDGSGNFTSVVQIKVDNRFRSYIVGVDITAIRTGGDSTKDDVGIVNVLKCQSLYTYADDSGPTFTAPANDAEGGTGDEQNKNENGCMFPIMHLCEGNANALCIWETTKRRSDVVHFELTNQGDIDVQVQEPPSENKVLAYYGTVTVQEVADLSSVTAAPAVRTYDLKRSLAFYPVTRTTDGTETTLAKVKVEPDTIYVVDLEVFAQYVGGSGDTTLLHQMSYANCTAIYDYSSDGTTFQQTDVRCSYPRRHLCHAGTCVWNQDVFASTPPNFTTDGGDIALTVTGDTDRTIVWLGKLKVRQTVVHRVVSP